MAHAHIQRLKAEIAKLREAHPETAALMSENEMLRNALADIEAREKTLASAIDKALAGPGYPGHTDDPKLPLGQGADVGLVAKCFMLDVAENETAALKARDAEVKKVRPRKVQPAHDMTDAIRKRRAEIKRETG
jgi:hypothetical protein